MQCMNYIQLQNTNETAKMEKCTINITFIVSNKLYMYYQCDNLTQPDKKERHLS